MEFICRESPELAPSADPTGRLHTLLNPPDEAMEPPSKKRKAGEEEVMVEGGEIDGDVNGLSDNENSEDEQIEHAPWEEVDMNPAIELVNKVVRECLEAGKTYNKSITAKTSQVRVKRR